MKSMLLAVGRTTVQFVLVPRFRLAAMLIIGAILFAPTNEPL